MRWKEEGVGSDYYCEIGKKWNARGSQRGGSSMEYSCRPDEERGHAKVGEEALRGSMRLRLIDSMEESWLSGFILLCREHKEE